MMLLLAMVQSFINSISSYGSSSSASHRKAERKQSLGYDWHPECLRCEECGKRLNPGQHAEHKGIPYCHVPCYGALFGPQLFGKLFSILFSVI